jgi:hypothetical protein
VTSAPPCPPATGAGPDFSLSEDQLLLREQVRRFAEERIRPGVQERDRAHRFPSEIVAEMGELGMLGMLVDEEHGGAGADVLTYVLAVEELARVCPATAVTMSVSNSVCCWPIGRFGSAALKRRVLPQLAAGALGAFGLTEPGAGSDAASLRTAARRDGDSWVLSGEKAWISNAGFARYYVVLARTDPAAGKRGVSAFVVPSDAPGFSPTAGCPPRTCSAALARASRSPSPPSTTRASGSAPRRSASTSAPSSWRSTTPASGCSSGCRSPATRRSASASPRWPPSWRRRAC